MRSFLPPLALLVLGQPMAAQITAGEVPNGMSALDLDIDLTLSTPFTIDSASLELDCDDFMDAWAVLVSGMPAVDAPNTALLQFVDTDIEVCMDMASGWQQRPKYYAFGEPLACSGSFNWQSASSFVLGDFGGFSAIGPIAMDSVYIAYRRDALVGWMLLSFDVQGGLTPVRLQVHQVLPICPSTTTIAELDQPIMILTPNPSNGEAIRVHSSAPLQRIDVLDATGKVLATYNGNARTLAAPGSAGAYVVRFLHSDGSRSATRLFRH